MLRPANHIVRFGYRSATDFANERMFWRRSTFEEIFIVLLLNNNRKSKI